MTSVSSRTYKYTVEDLTLVDLSDALIGYLESAYPDTLPNKSDFSEKDVWIKYGSVQVVRRLKEIRRQLEED